MQKTLAIFSPQKDAYSETFIHAHKNLPFVVKYYYGGWLPDKLEGETSLYDFNVMQKIRYRINKSLSVSEYALLFSLKKEKVDCVLAEYGPTACSILNVVKKLRLPMVVHFHGFDASRKSILQDFKEKYQAVFSYAYRVVAVSNRMKEDLIKLGCPENKILVSVYGPNPIFFDARPSFLNRQFVAIGRFTEKKAPQITIDAFANLVKEMPDCKLVMAGDGELWEKCKQQVDTLKISDKVFFKGAISPNAVCEILNDSIAFLQHSVIAPDGDSEGTPVAILEAQAAALPVISTFHAGIPDVVINNETGFLVEEMDGVGMTKYMKRILNEDGLAQTMGEKGRDNIRENYSMEKHLNTLAQVIGDSMVAISFFICCCL